MSCWAKPEVHLAPLQWEMLAWERMWTWPLSVVHLPASRISIQRMFRPWCSHRWQYVKEQSPQVCENTVNWSRLYWFEPAKTTSNGLASNLVPVPCFLLGLIPMHASGALCRMGVSILLLLLAFTLDHYSSSSRGAKHGRASQWGDAHCNSIGKG